MIRIGIDLGGTKIEAIAVAEDGHELHRLRIATPVGDYDGTIAALRSLVRDLELRLPHPASVGIGMPGAISPTRGTVKNANSTWLNGRPFVADVEAALGRGVRVANDANCFALSEAVDGAGAGAAMVFGVILGTGVGGGIAIDARIWTGRQSIAGEWGHNTLPRIEPVDLPMPSCYCGRSGCIETYLSGPAMAADHRACSGDDPGAPTDARSHIVSERPRSALPQKPPLVGIDHAMDAAAIVEATRRDDAAATATLARYVRRLAKSLASVINVLDPDVIVLGGGLSNIDELYTAVTPLLPSFVFSDDVTTPIVRNRHGDSSGVRGAAWLWSPSER